jgi:hypothetical protein
MTARRDPDAILAAWLEEGPVMLPEATRRAIDVTTRTTRQSRRPRWLPWASTGPIWMSRFALGAAIVAMVAGGFVILRPGIDPLTGQGGPPTPTPSALPSAAPEASLEIPVPELSQAFTSGFYGYSIRYPAGWQNVPPTSIWSPPEWKASNAPEDSFDFLMDPAGQPAFRAASAVLPDGAVADDWIDEFMTYSSLEECAPPRNTLEEVVIGGQPGRLRGFCEPSALEIESTVIVGSRVYMFTLFFDEWTAGEANARAWFDAFVATIQLQPGDALGPTAAPSAGPSAGPSAS